MQHNYVILTGKGFHDMLKRLPYMILALAVVLSFSVLYGANVRAASPIFYDGTVTWAVGRRDTSNVSDFNYATLTEQLPRYGSMALIAPELCGIPGNASTSTFNTFPSFIAVNSSDLARNGGYVYVCFCFAYCNLSSWGNNVTFDSTRVTAKLFRPGSFDNAMTSGVTCNKDRNVNGSTSSNTSYEISPTALAIDIPEIYPAGFQLPDGANFPHIAYFGYPLSGYFDPNYCFYNFGDTASNWVRTAYYSCRFTVRADNTVDGYNTVWINLSDCLRASFASASKTLLFQNGDTPVTATGYECSCVYLCPIFCFATSSNDYQPVEQALDNIIQKLDGISSNVPQSVLESYAALGSEAREAAHAAASQMAQNYPTYDPSAMDISNYVNPTAKAQFKSVVGFLSNRRILPIIGIVFTLVLIGYVFFGKK